MSLFCMGTQMDKFISAGLQVRSCNCSRPFRGNRTFLRNSRRAVNSFKIQADSRYIGGDEDLSGPGQRPNSSQLQGQYFGNSPQSSSRPQQQVHQRIHPTHTPTVASQIRSKAVIAGVALLGLTFVIAVSRQVSKFQSLKAVRQRTMNKNKLVVESLDKYLPEKRQNLTPKVTGSLQFKTGFKAGEIFRKYLWYLLRERKFDQEAVNDIVYLKSVLNLSDDQTAEALKERASRIYSTYGNIMLNTQGMTAAGIERKATARALFSKLLYLSEYEELIPPYSPAAEKASMRDVFGATEEDVNRLRIVSLQEVDLDKLEGQFDPEDGAL